jgi:ribosomal protein L11 methyltransferase
MAKWYEITITTSSSCSDLVADILFSEGSQGVSIKDKQDLIDLYKSSVIWDYIDENAILSYDECVYVKAVFGEEGLSGKIESIKNALLDLKKNSPFNVGAVEIITNPLDDTDWRNEWKKYYKPIVTASVTVVPIWIKYVAAVGEKLLKINPGMAFGTGEHETTKMCLELLAQVDCKGKSVLDVGTGSGILGIASVLCGAKSAYMCDIDTAAIETAKENIHLNGVEDSVVVEVADLLEKAEKKGDLIFANITADILVKLSKGIVKHLNEGGTIILSGIIHSRMDEVLDAYKAQGLSHIQSQKLGEWNALMFKK